MNYKEVLRHQPWLQLVNKHNISFRFLKYTHGDMFIAFNKLNQEYEVHSVRSYRLTASSCNGVLEPTQVNGFAYENFREHELKKFMLEIQSDNDKINFLYDNQEDMRKISLQESLKSIQNTLGTRV